jgi:hypothetical protein
MCDSESGPDETHISTIFWAAVLLIILISNEHAGSCDGGGRRRKTANLVGSVPAMEQDCLIDHLVKAHVHNISVFDGHFHLKVAFCSLG